jgi:hypothetical protein
MPVILDRFIKGDSKYQIDYLLESHNAYSHYFNRWQFLRDSYNGGYDYFMGKYLEPYYYESRDDYEKRLRMLALDNHVKAIVGIYTSFLFRKEPKRDYGTIDNDPALQAFTEDADLDGRSFQAFLRDAATMAMVYGNAWIIVEKPVSVANTRADELNQNIRPYVSLFTPENVLDWEYERQPNGLYELTYLKIKEEIVNNKQFIREYTKNEIHIYKMYGEDRKAEYIETIPNTIGKIPAVCLYAQRSAIRGVGVSAVGDQADMQRSIYEELNEIQSIIRLTNHPSLVKTTGTQASAGAGSIIQMEDNLDPGLKPFLLQPSGASIEAVLESVQKKVDAINQMSSVGGIRSIESRRLSGIALSSEFQLLGAKISDFALNCEHVEEQIWRLWCMFQGTTWNGKIEYPRSFSIQDKANSIAMFKMAKESNIENPEIIAQIDQKIYETLMEKDYDLVANETPALPTTPNTPNEHPPLTDQNNLVKHMREMVEQGYTDEQILELHPELGRLFNNG